MTTITSEVLDTIEALTFADLRAANITRQEHWGGTDNWTLADWSNAVAGEVGEACNVVKKIRRPQLGTKGNEADAPAYYSQLESEIGDVLIYLDLLAKAAGLDLAACVLRAFNEKSAKLDMPVRLLARKSLASPVVKELVWREHPDRGDWQARSVAGHYTVAFNIDDERGEWWSVINPDGDEIGVFSFPDDEKAKAAAQADYTARIMSALSPAAPAPDVTKALRTARDTFRVEYDAEGNPASVSYDSEALRPLVAMLDAALATKPAEPEGVDLHEREEAVMREYRIGNLTPLGVANALRRAGFKMEYAVEKANALAPSASPVSASEWVTVPREPTPEMMKAAFGWREFDCPSKYEGARQYYGSYRAMLSAAPSPAAEAKPVAWAWELQLNGHGPGHTYLAVEKPEFAPADLPLVRNLRALYASPLSLRAEAIEALLRDLNDWSQFQPAGTQEFHRGIDWMRTVMKERVRSLASAPKGTGL